MFKKQITIDPATLTGDRLGEVPHRLIPQLPVLVNAPPDGPEWLHEIKYDGYRMTISVRNGQPCLWTRNGYNWTPRLQRLAAAIEDLGLESAAFDSELVCLDDQGKTDFELLQSCMAGANRGRPLLYLFDLVHLEGTDLSRVPLIDRKELLLHLLKERTDSDTSILRYSDHITGNGPRVYAHACRYRLEGIVSKRVSSPYREGSRSTDWLKTKNPAYHRPFRCLPTMGSPVLVSG